MRELPRADKAIPFLATLLIGLVGCAGGLVSGPWPQSSERPVAALPHPSLTERLTADPELVDAHRLVIFGDQRALADGEWQAMVSAIADRETRERPEPGLLAVLDSGDIVFDGTHSDQFGMLTEILQPLSDYPYLLGVGNHEVHKNRGPGRRHVVQFLGDAIGEPFAIDRFYYRRDVGAHRMLFLDSNDLVYGADGEHPIERGLDERSRRQLDWLEAELGETPDRIAFTTVVLHHPFVISSRKHEGHAAALWSLVHRGRTLPEILLQGGVDLVVAGHTHTYERFAITDPRGRRMQLLNVSGRPRNAFLFFGAGSRRARDIRGRELKTLTERGWEIEAGWQIDQLEAMIDDERNQWVELRIAEGEVGGQVFYVDPRGRVSEGEAFRLP